MKLAKFYLISIFFILNSFLSFCQKIKSIPYNLKPSIFCNLDDSCATPDALAINKKGELFLSVTNATTYNKFGSKIISFDKQNNAYTWFQSLPLHPKTQKVHPMGLTFGNDENLYILDNQFFAGLKNGSRILRVNLKNNKPLNAEVLVEGLTFANSIKFFNNKFYVTDSWDSVDKRKSYLYCFSLQELNQNKIVLDSNNINNYRVCSFRLKDSVPNNIGVDGLEVDANGNIYCGSFGDGLIYKIITDINGKFLIKETWFESDDIKCCDGFYLDKKYNYLYIANFTNNSIHAINLKNKKSCLLWQNDNSNGENGFLDNPCETIIYKSKLLVVNFDTFKGAKNKEIDNLNTISLFNKKHVIQEIKKKTK